MWYTRDLMEDAGEERPLDKAEVLAVLRYWLAALRHEEALAVRPRAAPRRTAAGRAGPDLRQPGEGRTYFKLVPGPEAPGIAAFLLRAEPTLALPADEERLEVFERWLRAAYRRDRLRARGGARDVGGPTFLVGFPVVHFEAGGELATLLRFPLDDLVWRDAGGSPWMPPPWEDRRAGRLPAPPASLTLRAAEEDEDDPTPPYAVDADLLGRTLGVDEEAVEDFLAGLRRDVPTPEAMIAAVAGLLGPADATPAGDAPLEGLVRAMAARLAAGGGPRARVYPVALVYDGSQSYATYHLQRDLQAVLDAPGLGETRSPFGVYVSGTRPRIGAAPRAGVRPGSRPTVDQTLAAERFLGSTFTAVEGPPGTGKTELILDLIAECLVARVRAMAERGSARLPSRPLLVVASTNNRAVDNAVDPLGRDWPADRLPITLRTGNREVTRTTTADTLSRVADWLEARDGFDAGDRLRETRESFRAAWRAYELADGASPERVEREQALFDRACEVREAWALQHRDALLTVLDRALAVIADRGTLRPIFEDEAGATGTWLRRLFPALGSTLLSLGSVFPMETGAFDRLVIDEAGQCHPAYAVAGLYRCERALVIGDVHQLEPVYQLDPSDEKRVRAGLRLAIDDERLAPFRIATDSRTSAQALANRAAGEVITLHDHFRCQAPIIAISDALCGYGLRVRTPPRSLADRAPWLRAPVLLAPVQGTQSPVGGSWRNEPELEVTLQLLRRLQTAAIPWSDVAVITPYRAQLDALRRRLRAAHVPVDDDEPVGDLFAAAGPGVALGTVHRFQGGERSVVIFTTVVTRPRSLQFLDDRVNLVNVAVSRARDHLIIVGHPETLRAGRHTRLLIDHATPLP